MPNFHIFLWELKKNFPWGKWCLDWSLISFHLHINPITITTTDCTSFCKSQSVCFPYRLQMLYEPHKKLFPSFHLEYVSLRLLLTLNAEHLSQFQSGSSDFAQGSDDAFGVGLGQKRAGVHNRFLIFTWRGTKMAGFGFHVQRRDAKEDLWHIWQVLSGNCLEKGRQKISGKWLVGHLSVTGVHINKSGACCQRWERSVSFHLWKAFVDCCHTSNLPVAASKGLEHNSPSVTDA